MEALIEAGLQILPFLFFLYHLQALIRLHSEVLKGISIHNTHVMNNFHPLLLEVSYKKGFESYWTSGGFLGRFCPDRLVFTPCIAQLVYIRGSLCTYEGVNSLLA